MNNEIDRRDFLKISGIATGAMMVPAGLQRVFAQGRTKRGGWDHYFLGASYYPEWWDPSEWERDFRVMVELGFNTVRMGEFAWALFEPSEGNFRFEWMDKAIALANRYHIDVILGTPTASVPPWLHQLHPDVLGANEIGPYTYGGRKGYCVNSGHYLQACGRIVTALATHYGNHPGVIGWQLDNEPGGPFKCFDTNCENAFRLWLQKRYGTLDALNKAWGGTFWSNLYTDWAQIDFPKNSAESGWQPAISLDYRRFFSDSYLNDLRLQAGIIRSQNSKQFIFTNWPLMTWSVDPYKASEFFDACAWDNYCEAPGGGPFQNQYYAGFQNDIARCTGPNQRFFCAEQMAYIPPNRPQQGLRLQAYINLAHGSYGNIYFEWRRPVAGNEEERPSMVMLYDGSINPAKAVFEQVGKEFAMLGPALAGAVTRSGIAIIYDYDNQWAQGFFGGAEGYDQEATRYYHGLKSLQQNIDIISSKAPLTGYRVVVAPGLVMVDDDLVKRLEDFVAGGSALVLNSRAGTRNMANGMRKALSPGPFQKMAGVSVSSSVAGYSAKDALPPGTNVDIIFAGNNTAFKPRTTLEDITLHSAEAIASYRGGLMEGLPAITVNQFGKGQVFYVGTDSAQDSFHEYLAGVVAAKCGLSPLIKAPYGVEVTSREKDDKIFYFMLNLTETAHAAIDLPYSMDNLLNGQAGISKIDLEALGVAVLVRKS